MSLVNLPKIILGMLILMFGLTIAPSSNMESINFIKPVQVNVDMKQLKCMANNIYFEAGHEGLLGMAAVARVVMNRVSHGFSSTPCGVINQSTISNDKKMCQFSWVCEGKSTPTVRNHRYRQAEQVAYDVLVNNRYTDVLPKTALFFHNTTIDPLWPYKKVAQIGNHIFYSKSKRI